MTWQMVFFLSSFNLYLRVGSNFASRLLGLKWSEVIMLLCRIRACLSPLGTVWFWPIMTSQGFNCGYLQFMESLCPTLLLLGKGPKAEKENIRES